MKKRRIIIAALLITTIFLLHISGVRDYINLATIQQHAQTIHAWATAQPVAAVAIYILLLVAATCFYIPATVALSIAGGFLFGAIPAALYACFGATLGSVILFVTVRYVIGNYIQKRYKEQLHIFNAELNAHGDHYLLTLQLLPITPTFVINTFAGLTQISLWTFSWTTFIGMLPGAALYTFAGQQLHAITSARDLISWRFVLLLLLLSLLAFIPVLMRYIEKK